MSDSRVTRRAFLAAGSIGAMASVAMRGQAAATQLSTGEQANLTSVNDFCAAFTVPLDWARIASFLSDDCKYRASQTIQMVEGPDAIVGLLQSFVGTATSVEFEMLDTWARGPVVVNDRVGPVRAAEPNPRDPGCRGLLCGGWQDRRVDRLRVRRRAISCGLFSCLARASWSVS